MARILQPDHHFLELLLWNEEERWQEISWELKECKTQFQALAIRKRVWMSPGMPPDRVCAFCGGMGMHYSELRPRITDGDERYNIIRQD
ncbi:unnamed protein product [Heligmosomoides polygyrus]|uniref:Uncharacterized protein n=1 Tax=Heligmosomoides polygyrus TaxID=6339 RepID=A0A183GP26_HELPZ|nr:unnamed protein product [Heligmosomoides polygyrus]